MKKSITLSLPQSCAEQWSNFTPTTQGGWCGSCKKEVVDFTNMTDEEVIHYFSKTNSNTCGRFYKNQLKSYDVVPVHPIKPGWAFLRAGMLGMFLALASTSASAFPPVQMITQSNEFNASAWRQALPPSATFLTGTVTTAEEGTPLAGVNIVLKGTTVGTITDEHGKFKFDRELKEGDVLIFTFVGYEKYEYTVSSLLTPALNVVMKIDYNLVILGEVQVGQVYAEPQPTGFQKWWNKVKNIF